PAPVASAGSTVADDPSRGARGNAQSSYAQPTAVNHFPHAVHGALRVTHSRRLRSSACAVTSTPLPSPDTDRRAAGSAPEMDCAPGRREDPPRTRAGD